MDEPKKSIIPETKALIDKSHCVDCRRYIPIDELYGAFGMCSQCLAEGFDEHDGG